MTDGVAHVDEDGEVTDDHEDDNEDDHEDKNEDGDTLPDTKHVTFAPITSLPPSLSDDN
jgi:hypothetical protein